MKRNIEIKTFGCKLNHYDSVLLRERVSRESGHSNSGESGPSESGESGAALNRPVVIFNTCAVTAEAGREARREAARLKKKNPGVFLAVTGCGAQTETELYAKSPWVDLVVGNSHKKDLPLILKNRLAADKPPGGRGLKEAAKAGSSGQNASPNPASSQGAGSSQSGAGGQNGRQKVFKSNIFKSAGIYSGLLSPEESRTRSFLKIQDGCDSFCAFCIIPFARGKSRSLPVSHILRAARKLAREGAEEIVLTGVHIGDYKDGERGLEYLVGALLKETAIPRLRLSSLEPPDLTEGLLDCYENERLCPHFHLSVQSASSRVLSGMKRKYSRKDVERSFHRIAKKIPAAFVGMDLIAGFPSESEEDFQETYQVLKDSPWTKIHVFPYSPREGTYAARKAGFGRGEILRRAGQIRSLSGFRYESERRRQTGRIKKALLFKGDSQKGLTRDYWRVSLPPSSRKGEHRVWIQGADPGSDSLKAAFL